MSELTEYLISQELWTRDMDYNIRDKWIKARAILQRQTAVSAYLKCKQLPLFVVVPQKAYYVKYQNTVYSNYSMTGKS